MATARTTVTEFDRVISDVRAAFLNAVATASAAEEADPRDLCALIAEERRAAGLSLQAVATAAGLSKAHVWDLERGHSRNPTVEAMLGLSVALGLPFVLVAVAALRSYKSR